MGTKVEIERIIVDAQNALLTGSEAARAILATIPTADKLRAALIEAGFVYEHAGKLHTAIRGDEVVERDFANLVKLLGLPNG